MKTASSLSTQFIGIFIASLAFFVIFNPYHIQVHYYAVPFMLLGALMYIGATLLLRSLAPDSAAIKRKLIAAASCVVLLISLALSSLGQFNLADVLVLLALVIGLTAYIRESDIFT